MLIALDGIDGVGKGTQSKLLFDYLINNNYKARLISFPRYNSFFGKMIGEYLNGNYGEIDEINPKLIAPLYAFDRKFFFENTSFTENEIIICDRYVPSNIAHQAAKLTEDNQNNFIHWIEQLEYDINKIPKPTIVFILDVSVKTAMSNVKSKKKRDYTALSHDIHESNYAYLKKTKNFFIELTKRDNYFLINCEQNNRMAPINIINKSIRNILDKYI